MKDSLVPLVHTCANLKTRCEWLLQASYQDNNNLQTPKIRPWSDESTVVIQPVNSLRTANLRLHDVDLKELIRIYIKRALILVVENCS